MPAHLIEPSDTDLAKCPDSVTEYIAGLEQQLDIAREAGNAVVSTLCPLCTAKAIATLSGEEFDYHRVVASYIFRVPVDKVTPEMRRSAKAINFGSLYSPGPDVTNFDYEMYEKMVSRKKGVISGTPSEETD